ncbi:MAG: hypothetical protein AB7F35_26625 [Acetobacteraceae bacterium]
MGQRIEVTLTAMTPVRFASPPSWPDLAVSHGRIILLPEASTVPGTEHVNGVSYAALQHSYSIFAAEAGTVVLAPVEMSVRVGGPDGQPVNARASTGETRLTTRVPPGVMDVARLVVAPSFRMTAATESNAAEIRVGQAVVRTLHMEAEDTTAMLLPAGAWGSPEGVRVYPDPPVLQDRSDRGVFRALRSERVGFVPQRPGQMELPGFSVTWFDPRSGRAREVKVDPLRLDVLPAAAAGAGRTRGHGEWLLPASAAAALVLAGILALWWHRREHQREASPIQTLAFACRSGNAKAALRALYRWSDALLPPGEDRTLATLAQRADAPALTEQVAALEAHALGDHAVAWNGDALLSAARATERALRHTSRGARHTALPPLNPLAAPAMAPRLTQPRWVR